MLVIVVAARLLPSEAAGWGGGGRLPRQNAPGALRAFCQASGAEDKRTPRYALQSCGVESLLMRKNDSLKSFCVSVPFPGCVGYPTTAD